MIQNGKISPLQNLPGQIFPVEMTHNQTCGDTVVLQGEILNGNYRYRVGSLTPALANASRRSVHVPHLPQCTSSPS